MRILLFATASAICSLLLPAQSPLTTLFASNNNGNPGGSVLFDLTANIGVAITQIDLNTRTTVNTTGTLDILTVPTTRVGNENNQAAWTVVSSGNPLVTSASDTPTVCMLTTPVVLPPGSYGIMLIASSSWNHAYTNGTGTNQNYSTADLSFVAGAAQNVPFQGLFTPRVPNLNIHYQPAVGFAAGLRYGLGCPRGDGVPFYEMFSTPAAFDLANSGLSMILVRDNEYFVVPSISAYSPPSLSATTLALGDNSEITVNLTSPLRHAGGVTTSLTVSSNGVVSTATGNGFAGSPSTGSWLGFTATNWANWHDYNPAAGGAVKFEEVGNVAYVTFENVADAGVPASQSTFQFQFDRGSDFVHVVFGNMSGTGGGHLVGFKAAGGFTDPGAIDITAELLNTFSASGPLQPLSLAATARPVTNTSIGLVTSSTSNASFGAHVLSLSQLVPIDLTSIGMPGCFQHAGLDAALFFTPTGGQGQTPLLIPNNPTLAGVSVYCQSVAFGTAFNALGAIASNGLELRLGNQ